MANGFIHPRNEPTYALTFNPVENQIVNAGSSFAPSGGVDVPQVLNYTPIGIIGTMIVNPDNNSNSIVSVSYAYLDSDNAKFNIRVRNRHTTTASLAITIRVTLLYRQNWVGSNVTVYNEV